MNLLTSAYSDKERAKQPAMVTRENYDQYEEPIPINPLFKPAFNAVYQHCAELKRMNIVVDHDMSKEEAEKRYEVGVFETSFGGWTCVLNWTEEKRGNIPPDYIAIDFKDVSCGIIGKWATIRTCWHCGMTGYRDPEHKHPCVIPAQYNETTGIWEMHPCPKCGNLDWWARTILPDHFQRDAAELIADHTGKTKMFEAFGGSEMDYRLRV